MGHADESLYLAIDQGSHSSRAIAFDRRGYIQARARHSIDTLHPHSNWVEHDAEALVDATTAAIRELADTLDQDVDHLIAGGIATQRSSIVCWNPTDGNALSNVISWQDRRAAEWLESFEPAAERVHAITGLVLSPHYGVSKLRWCLDELPAVNAALADGELALGPLSSFLLNRLLDERPVVADPANASRTLLWDFRTGDWSSELLELFSVPAGPLPLAVPSRHDFGQLRVGDRKLPIVVSTGDQSAALFAFGEPQPSTVFANLGTGAFLQQVVGNAPVAAPGLLSGVAYQDDRHSLYVLEGTVNGAGAAILKITDELDIDRDEMKANSTAWLDQVREPPLFINGVGGLGAPFWIPDFPVRFIDGAGADAPAKIVAVIESILFLLNVNLSVLAQHAQRPARLVITGGLAGLDPLCQRFADLTGLPVHRPQVREATAQGVAYLLAGRPERWSAAEPDTEFEPRTNEALHARYRKWRSAMENVIAEFI